MTATAQKQVLMNARALISSHAHWTRSKLACTADGRRVEPHDPSAAKWCAMGAILRAAYDLVGDGEEARRIGDEIDKRICPTLWRLGGLPAINDVRGHAAVLAVFDKGLQAI